MFSIDFHEFLHRGFVLRTKFHNVNPTMQMADVEGCKLTREVAHKHRFPLEVEDFVILKLRGFGGNIK